MQRFTAAVDALYQRLYQHREECKSVDLQFQAVDARIAFVKEKEGNGAYAAITDDFQKIWQRLENHPPNTDDYSERRALMRERLKELICAGGLNTMVYEKPLGYAGDYLTIYNYFLEYAGTSTYEIFINQYSRSLPVAVAHRNRIPVLIEAFAGLPPGSRIMSIGCGPAIEILRASGQGYFDALDFFLYDTDERALDFVRSSLPPEKTNVHLHLFSILSLLQTMNRQRQGGQGMDLIYCCGLYDYINDRLAGRLLQAMHDNLSPDGRILVTNVDSTVSGRAYFEFFAGWQLTLRSETGMARLAEKNVASAVFSTKKCPETGANVYLQVDRKVR